MKVLVYGEWPNQSNNVKPFFTASFSESEKTGMKKEFISPFKFLFVGSLVEGKRPLFAIRLIESLMSRAIPVKLELYGEGILRKELEEYVEQKNLDPFITFYGNRKLEEVKEAYQNSHFLILASRSEGWPKAVAEAMFFGCIPLATSVSCLPWMLDSPPTPGGGAGRGIILFENEKREESREKREERKAENRDVEKEILDEAVNKIMDLLNNPQEMQRKSVLAKEWSQEYTLERFERAIKQILENE